MSDLGFLLDGCDETERIVCGHSIAFRRARGSAGIVNYYYY
jgi:hypothetical protein